MILKSNLEEIEFLNEHWMFRHAYPLEFHKFFLAILTLVTLFNEQISQGNATIVAHSRCLPSFKHKTQPQNGRKNFIAFVLRVLLLRIRNLRQDCKIIQAIATKKKKKTKREKIIQSFRITASKAVVLKPFAGYLIAPTLRDEKQRSGSLNQETTELKLRQI
ncbi:CLUMA_CG000478, isoform A [Clunio marinus]|uniref:CLUMA_CG000478, isoform A n=1 Tax=Clunio marinus TaxID=568069 RepID=A0A1J1HGG8_9DIPT|nr:CLUMA_CG000478, isoform A [Clunio marinus]